MASGARLYVAKFAEGVEASGYGAGDKLFDSKDASWFTFEDGEKMFYIGEGKLAEGDRVIAYVLDGWTIVAQSEPVTVQAAGSATTTSTRQEVIDACSVTK